MSDEPNYTRCVDALIGGTAAVGEEGISVLTLDQTMAGGVVPILRMLEERGALRTAVIVETSDESSLAAMESIAGHNIPDAKLVTCSLASAATYLMTKNGVDACLVAADTICSNGDCICAVGSCIVALFAAALDIPYHCVAPASKIHLDLKAGDTKILLTNEIDTHNTTPSRNDDAKQAGEFTSGKWNPSEDVIPCNMISGIITEKGIIRKCNGVFDVAAFLSDDGLSNNALKNSHEGNLNGGKYQELTADSTPLYLSTHAPVVMKALGATSFVDLDCNQVEGGDRNLIFTVTNSINGEKVIVKQALPYVRTAAEAWPMPLERTVYEYTALKMQRDACPLNVPYVYYFNKVDAVIVMEYIPLSCIVLRKGLIGGIKFKTVARDMGEFVANTLFKSSGFKLSASELRQQVKFWSQNTHMCGKTVRCVFTEPYIDAANNRWTRPHLDDYKKAIEMDSALKVAAAKMKHKFVTKTEALLHADLRTDAVLCSPEGDQTYVIDPRFSFYGPMAFDIGAFLANLLLSYVSQGGHTNEEGYDEWILVEQIGVFWKSFRKEFLRLWDDEAEHTGYRFQRTTLGEDDATFVAAQEDFLAELLSDTLGFAGMKMLRRIVGSNHVEDLESIADVDVRARCEIHGLEIAFCLIKNSDPPNSIDDVIGLAREKKPE